MSGIVLRDCHVGLWPPRNDKPLIFTILTIASLFRRCSAGPAVRSPTRRVRSAMPPYNLPVCKALSERRYTLYFGAYRLSAAGMGRQCPPEIATGAKRPRNDNSGAGTILTPSRSYRKCSAGPGCPLPAGRRGAAPERFFPQNTRWGLTFCPLRSKLWLEITN